MKKKKVVMILVVLTVAVFLATTVQAKVHKPRHWWRAPFSQIWHALTDLQKQIDKMNKGMKVAKGEKGEKGEQGLQGPPGKDGNDGKDGRDGVDGVDGADGKDGKDCEPQPLTCPGCNFSNSTDLEESDFSGAYLINSRWTNAELTGANFTDAKLYNAYFVGANLQYAKFKGADLTMAWMLRADLCGADLSQAASLDLVDWAGVTCPDGYSADDNIINNEPSCIGHLIPASNCDLMP